MLSIYNYTDNMLQEAAAEKRELLFELGVLKEGAGQSDLYTPAHLYTTLIQH